MPPAGFDSTTPANERPQTHVLDRASIGIVLRWKRKVFIFQVVTKLFLIFKFVFQSCYKFLGSLCNCKNLLQGFCRQCALCISNISVIINYWNFVLKLLHFERLWRPSSSGKRGDVACWIHWSYLVSITQLRYIH